MSVQTKPNPLEGMAAFRRDCLIVLEHIGDGSGVEIQEQLQESGYGRISSARLYPNLDELDDAGLIEKHKHDPDDRTNRYRITSKGEETVEQFGAWVRGEGSS